MNPRDSIVLVGNSVRYLAQSARAAGVAVTAVDGFCDADTREASEHHQCASGLTPGHLSDAARGILEGRDSAWVYGAGFESRPSELLALTRHNRHVVGNDPSTVQLLADPRRLFALLSELDIPHPETKFEPVPADSGWLIKPAGGSGGLDVRRCTATERLADDAPVYLQRFVNGALCSLLFVADGTELEVIGFNQPLARFASAGDYRFAGVIGGLAPGEAVEHGMLTAARRLTRTLGLRGVNGIDFVMDRGRPLFIDLNARPTAALELYEDVLPAGGYLCHVNGCRGELTLASTPRTVRGMRVVYARQSLRVGAIDWPAWVTDRPVPGEYIPADQPLCTVHAQGPDRETVEARLRERFDGACRLLVARNEYAA